jgi:hypothetical protein
MIPRDIDSCDADGKVTVPPLIQFYLFLSSVQKGPAWQGATNEIGSEQAGGLINFGTCEL